VALVLFLPKIQPKTEHSILREVLRSHIAWSIVIMLQVMRPQGNLFSVVHSFNIKDKVNFIGAGIDRHMKSAVSIEVK
jgi:hypothetical protein